MRQLTEEQFRITEWFVNPHNKLVLEISNSKESSEMINPKQTMIPSKEESIYLFEHIETKLKFAVYGYGLHFHVDGIKPAEDDHLIVLSDAHILTGFDFREFKIYPQCPRDMSKILNMLDGCGQKGLLRPTIQVSVDLFNAAYGIKNHG